MVDQPGKVLNTNVDTGHSGVYNPLSTTSSMQRFFYEDPL
jgi:hypothetical protein